MHGRCNYIMERTKHFVGDIDDERFDPEKDSSKSTHTSTPVVVVECALAQSIGTSWP